MQTICGKLGSFLVVAQVDRINLSHRLIEYSKSFCCTFRDFMMITNNFQHESTLFGCLTFHEKIILLRKIYENFKVIFFWISRNLHRIFNFVCYLSNLNFMLSVWAYVENTLMCLNVTYPQKLLLFSENCMGFWGISLLHSLSLLRKGIHTPFTGCATKKSHTNLSNFRETRETKVSHSRSPWNKKKKYVKWKLVKFPISWFNG